VDLHDTANGRMLEKNVIRKTVPWARARQSFYWRLRRKLAEENVKTQIRNCFLDLSDGQVDARIRRWYATDRDGQSWDDDKAVALWWENQLLEDNKASITQETLRCLRREAVVQKIENLVTSTPDTLMDTIVKLSEQLNTGQCAELAKLLASRGGQQQQSDAGAQ